MVNDLSAVLSRRSLERNGLRDDDYVTNPKDVCVGGYRKKKLIYLHWDTKWLKIHVNRNGAHPCCRSATLLQSYSF